MQIRSEERKMERERERERERETYREWLEYQRFLPEYPLRFDGIQRGSRWGNSRQNQQLIPGRGHPLTLIWTQLSIEWKRDRLWNRFTERKHTGTNRTVVNMGLI